MAYTIGTFTYGQMLFWINRQRSDCEGARMLTATIEALKDSEAKERKGQKEILKLAGEVDRLTAELEESEKKVKALEMERDWED